MEPKPRSKETRVKSFYATKEDKAARAKTARGKEITREIIEHAFVYRCMLTRTFDE